MEVLGIGPLELFFILIIALIVLGPKDMVKAGKTLGGLLRRLVKSPVWAAMQQTSREIRTLPNKLMRDAGLEESIAEVQQIGRDFKKEAAMIESLRRKSISDVKANTSDVEPKPEKHSNHLEAWTTPKTGNDISSIPVPADGLSAWTTPATGSVSLNPPSGSVPATPGISDWTNPSPDSLPPDEPPDIGTDPTSEQP